MLPATALGRGSRKEPLQPGGFLLSHTLWVEGSKSFGREGGHRTRQSFDLNLLVLAHRLKEATSVLTILLDYKK